MAETTKLTANTPSFLPDTFDGMIDKLKLKIQQQELTETTRNSHKADLISKQKGE